MHYEPITCRRSGYDRLTSNAIDGFARDAVRFDNAIAQAPYTKASVASIMTGLYPSSHKTVTASVPFPDTMTGRPITTAIVTDILPAAVTTLAEGLHDAGYRTFGYTANPFLSEAFGFARVLIGFASIPVRTSPVRSGSWPMPSMRCTVSSQQSRCSCGFTSWSRTVRMSRRHGRPADSRRKWAHRNPLPIRYRFLPGCCLEPRATGDSTSRPTMTRLPPLILRSTRCYEDSAMDDPGGHTRS